ncbi:hypothetical protein [Methylomonas rivi]|uniref:Uncharacterized protein n=1 Tax=Methylomonas rivi TaxID=2952226 RepID=A0ABT1U3Z1_9GAMM|nr:hypothetical protein [Methylomonas sp. WSC-6]MCQ8128564.1 hypothetical protein [Methylomonas sp. WSC-6]
MKIQATALIIALALSGFTSLSQAAPQMRVTGRVDANGDAVFESNQTDVETGTPEFNRSAISVADSDNNGLWRYLARVDSTVPKLQISGSLENNTGDVLDSVELGLLSTFARYVDTITLSPQITAPYLVTIDMVVDGLLTIDGSISRAAAGLVITPVGQLQSFDFQNYTSSGSVQDVLSAQYQFQGDAVFDLDTSLQFSILQLDPGINASGDFSHTAVINLILTDLNGNPLPDNSIRVTSDSGFFQTAPVPLPSALMLFVAGLSGLLVNAKRTA